MFYAEELASFYSKLDFKHIPDEVVKKTRLSLFDFFAVLAAGSFQGILSPVIKKYIEQKIDNGTVTVLGLKIMASAETAAFGMGAVAHSVELDDGHRYGTAHPGVAVIPCALALAEKENASYGDIIRAIIIGYDAMLRAARSINPSHLKRGFHSTGTCGAIGAAAAAAAIFGFDAEKTAFTISMGALQSAGLQEMLHGNPSIKVIQPGKAAQAGVLSAELVRLGAKSPLSVFEGQHGWLKAMTDEYDEKALIGDLGERWEIMHTYTKLYPTCRHCHQVIDMGAALFEEGLKIQDISKVELHTYDVAISEVGIIKIPKNVEEAMFSVAYALAIAIKYGKVRLDELEGSLSDTEIIDFAESVSIISDEEMNRKYPLERGAKINISLKNGKAVEKTAVLPKGEYDTPLVEKDYYAKAAGILEKKVSFEIIDDLWDISVIKPTDSLTYSNIVKLFEKIGV